MNGSFLERDSSGRGNAIPSPFIDRSDTRSDPDPEAAQQGCTMSHAHPRYRTPPPSRARRSWRAPRRHRHRFLLPAHPRNVAARLRRRWRAPRRPADSSGLRERRRCVTQQCGLYRLRIADMHSRPRCSGGQNDHPPSRCFVQGAVSIVSSTSQAIVIVLFPHILAVACVSSREIPARRIRRCAVSEDSREGGTA